jgi:hypothetical protein
MPANQHKSVARNLLISKFIHPRTPQDFDSDGWRDALSEDPLRVINQLLKEGVLVEADLDAKVDYKYKLDELKNLLKQHNLPISGRKGNLILRLVQTDPIGMQKAVAGLPVLKCSESARQLAEQYLLTEKKKREDLESQVIEYLRQRNYRQASIVVAAYEAEQVFPRGIGIDWTNHKPAGDMMVLNFMFTGKPKILAFLDDEKVDSLRLAAGMMHLFGTNQCKAWLPVDFQTGLKLDNNAAGRMFLFFALHKRTVSNYIDSGVIREVSILAAADSCEACKAIGGRKFRLNEIPELPFEHCSHQMGCRCTVLPIVQGIS